MKGDGMANRFVYKTPKEKQNGWEEGFQNEEYDAIPDNGPAFSFGGLGTAAACRSASQGFDLNSVWCIRNNVSLQSNYKYSPTKLESSSSNYSRHVNGGKSNKNPQARNVKGHERGMYEVGLNLGGGNSSLASVFQQRDESIPAREVYSGASSRSSEDEFQFDGESENNFKDRIATTERLFAKGPFGKAGCDGKSSARTSKVRRLNVAYQRSTGLGSYTPNSSICQKDNRLDPDQGDKRR